MKNAIKKILFSATVLFLSCAFAQSLPGASMPPSAVGAEPMGGAYLVFAGKYGGNIHKKDMEGQSVLGVEGCAKGARIFQFTLVVAKGGKTSSYKAAANKLTPEMLSALKSLSVGDSFEFKQVKAYMPNGKDVADVHAQKFIVA